MAAGLLGVLAGAVLSIYPASPAVAAAGINKQINFQGKVTNTNGTNVANGSYNFTFRIYTASTGNASGACSGVCVWQEASKSLTVTDGVFQTALGDTTSLPGSIDFNTDSIWLGITFNGDPEMSPRVQFTSVPYSFNSDKLQGLAASAFAQLSPGTAQSGFLNVTGNVTSGASIAATTSLQAPLVDTASAVALNIGTATASSLTLGRASASNAVTIQGSSASTWVVTGASGTTTLSFTAPTTTNAITFPNAGGNVCTSVASTCSSTYQAASTTGYILKNAQDTSSATTLGSLLGLTNTNTGAAGVLSLSNSGTNSALSVSQSGSPTTGQALILANGATGITGNLLDLQVNAVSKFAVDASGNATVVGNINNSTQTITTGNLAAATAVRVNNASATAGYISKVTTVGTGGVTANDVVVLDASATAVDTATARDIRVYGVAATTKTATQSVDVAISGNFQVTATTAAVSIGDQLVTSATSGQVFTDNNATTGILGTATSAKGAGASGLVGVSIRPVNGVVNPNLQAGNLTTTGTITSGLINGQTISAAANFTGSVTAATGIALTAGTLQVGGSTGTGAIVNNGSTVNTSYPMSNLATGGWDVLGAAGTVDKYTYITANQTTGSQTLTVPAPTAGTTYGRLLYLTNGGTASFTLLGTTIGAGSTATLVWANVNSVGTWTFAGADGSGILNQNGSDQTANFRISGTGRANTSLTTPLVDSISAGLNVGTSTATGVTIGGTTNTTALVLQGATGATYDIGTSTGTGTINVGESTAGQTIQIGHATVGAGNTQNISIGDSSTGTGKNIVSIGTANGASTTTIQAGTGTATGDLLIQAAAGGIVSIGNNAVANKVLNLGSAGNTNAASTVHIADTNANATQSVTIGNTTSANNVVLIQGGTSTTAISVQTASGGTINVGTATNSIVKIGSTTGAASITQLVGTGNFSLDGAAGSTYAIGASTTTGSITIGGTAQTGAISLGTGAGAGARAVTVGSTANASTLTLQSGTGALNLQTQGTAGINIGTNAVSQPILIGNTTGGTIRVGQNAGTLQLDGSNFDVSTAGQVILAGGQNPDITTLAGTAPTALVFQPGSNSTATSTGAAFTLQAGNDTGATASTGGLLSLLGGNATGGGQTGGGVTLDSGTGTTGGSISLGVTSAASIAIGHTGITTTVSGTQQIGATTGTGAIVNNGSTVNTSYPMGNLATGGWDAGGAAATVDKYTYITANQTTGSQTLTVPNPTASTTYGRLLYVTNGGTASFSMLGTTIGAGSTATLVWSLVNSVGKWTFAGADGSGILNQNGSDQTADFRITGTGRANTSLTTPLVDSISAGLNIGTSTATGVTIGGTTNTTAVTLQGAAAANYMIGTTTGTGAITVGQSNDSNVISIGAGPTATGKTQTIGIGNGTDVGTGLAAVTIGNTNGASSLLLQSGSGALNLQTQGGAGGINIATNAVSQNVLVGNAFGGTIRIGQHGGTLQLDGTNIGVSTGGVITLAGGQNPDITTLAGTSPTGLVFQPGSTSGATSTGAAFTLQAGNDTGATASTGGVLTLKGGNATGGSQTGGGVTIDSGSGTTGGVVNLGGTNAASVSIGKATTTTTISGTTQLGTTAGSGSILNNGATVNTAYAMANLATGGWDAGGAGATVDIYTYISANQNTAGQTLTPPSPTANATYGRLLYLSNIGTNSFTLLGASLSPGSTAALVWAHANGGDKWSFAGSDASGLQNAYNNSAGGTTPSIAVSTARSGVSIQNSVTNSIGAGTEILSVRSAAANDTTLGSSLLTVTSYGIGVNLGASAASSTAGDLQFGGTANRIIGVQSQASAATAGANLTVIAASGNTTGTGGVATLQGGIGGNAAAGGAVNVTGGTSGGGATAGGVATVQGGASNATAGSNGGAANLLGGAGTSTGTGGIGGAVNVTGGTSNGSGANAGGVVTVQGGTGSATGAGGAVTVQAGTGGSTSGTGGLLTLQGGTATAGSTTGGVAIDAGSGGTTKGAVTIGGANAGSVAIGRTGTTTTTNGTAQVGATAGTGALVNNGSTVNTAYTMANLATGGWDAGGAAATVDIYTYISANQTASGQTLTPPSPTANTTYGRLLYLSNIGTNSFTILGATLSTGSTAALVWAHANGGDKWSFAGSDASGLQTAYNNSAGGTTPSIAVSTVKSGISIQNSVTNSIAAGTELLTVRSAAANDTTLGSSLLTVTSYGLGVNLGTSAASATAGDLQFGGTANRTIGVQTQATAATAGANLSVIAATGNTSGAGGVASLQGGTGGTSGAGGAVNVTGGTSGGGATAGGLVTIQGGASNATAGSAGGGIAINGAAGSTTGTGAVGGSIILNAGNAGGSGANTGGAITLQGGTASNNAAAIGGAITIAGGSGGATAGSTGGGVSITGGAGSSTGTGAAGSGVTITGGAAGGSAANLGGGVTIAGGIATSTGTSGTVTIQGGAAAAVAGGVAGGVAINGGAGSTTGTGGAGAGITISGGSGGGSGNNNGGSITLAPGSPSNSGVPGVVSIATPVFTSYTNTTCATSCTLTSGNTGIDGNSTALVTVSSPGQTVTIPDPQNTTAGRILYVAAMPTSNDFTLSANGGLMQISMRADTTATMVWTGGGGGDWTAAGASASTSLQQVYNNTGSSPASIVTTSTAKTLNFQAGVGFDTTNVLQISNSVGAGVLAVDTTNTATGANLAQNGGVETGGTPPTGWSAYVGTVTPTVTQDTTAGEFAGGTGSVKVHFATAGTGGVNNLMNATALPTAAGSYVVSFNIKAGTSAPSNANLIVEYYRNNTPTLDATCSTFTAATNPVISTTGFIKYSCVLTTTGNAKATTNFLRIRQADSVIRDLYIDNLAIINENTTGAQNVSDIQVGGSAGNSQGLTLLTVDSFAGAPFATGATINTSLLGSLYYDTTVGKLQCYEAKGWGSCGNSPNNSAFLIPEYPNAVLGAASGVAAGIGTMTAGVCSGTSRLNVNTTLCAASEDFNYYAWTSPQSTSQTYSIYVRYQLPATYNGFLSSSTVKLVGRTTSTTDGSVVYSLYSATGSTACGTSASLGTTTVTSTANTWQQVNLGADETSGTADCTFAANDIITFRVDLAAKNNATVYASNLTFTTKGL